MEAYEYDFTGYATKFNKKCSDGRVIKPGAFVDNNGKVVPLVWQHNHDEPFNVLGHALLENRSDGVYAYCSLNDTEAAEHVRRCIKHGDLKALSIYANKLKEKNKNVMHGDIKEVSVVLAGANPGAFIDAVLMHSDDESFEATIRFYDGSDELDFEAGEVDLSHFDEEQKEPEEDSSALQHKDTENKEETPMANEGEKTVQDVLNELTDEQKSVVEFVIAETVKAAVEANEDNNDEEDKSMKHSVFENSIEEQNFELSAEDVSGILMHAASPNVGSLKVAVQNFIDMRNEEYLSHADGDDPAQTYGITSIDMLFPDYKNFTDKPEFIKRRTEWVNVVFQGVHHTPFSRIRSVFADITGEEARARGYVKGNLKIEEVFGLLKRETAPTTVYKKQKIDRDDRIDITDFDVVLWLKGEMRLMWEEEVARAILIGDGRDPVTQSADKIKEDCIRPIWLDAELFTVPERIEVAANATDEARTKALIKLIKKSRKDYKGSGNPILFTTIDFVTDCLLLEDGFGRPLYDTREKLATALMVSRIVEVEVMENKTRTVTDTSTTPSTTTTYNLVGLIVNLNDYNVGADKGGAAEMFEDFDIDYNQYKYLYEGRMSGALTKPFSALAIEYSVGASSVTETPAETPAG